MILLSAVIAGLIGGLMRAWIAGRRLQSPKMDTAWLALVAYLPQFLVFQFSVSRTFFSDGWAAITLVVSQTLLLIFAWMNRELAGFWLLALGLSCNLVVIAVNGGLMPISPETVARLAPQDSSAVWNVGERLGSSKDIVLDINQTKLWWLSDRYVPPTWFPYPVAFSLGDMLIAFGAFIFFWSLGSDAKKSDRIVRRYKENGM